MKSHANLSDIRGFIRLVIDQAELITDLVEDMHSTVAMPFGLVRMSPPEPTRGITDLIYHSIHECLHLVGTGVDAALGQVIPMFDAPPSTPNREAMLAALNGIWGDYLADSNSPLAIDMSLRHGGQSLTLEKPTIQGAIPQASDRVILLAHGFCMNDLQWSRGGHDHGAALTRDLGYTSVYLHYNSGLHISTNGRRLATLLETLINEWPQSIEELVIIGHSMGGLVAHSACHYGTLAGHTWRRHLRKLIFLGTPHHGSPLARVSDWTDELLKATRYTAPFRRLGTIRSAGITDLRDGNLVGEDWEELNRFARGPDNRRSVPLPSDVRCYAIGATIGTGSGDAKDRLLGDGLIPLDSALGLHNDPNRCLAFPQSQQWVGNNMGHLDLLNRPEVYQKIREWLAS